MLNRVAISITDASWVISTANFCHVTLIGMAGLALSWLASSLGRGILNADLWDKKWRWRLTSARLIHYSASAGVTSGIPHGS